LNTDKKYLYVESYVFPFKEDRKLLLYNTLNGDILEFEIRNDIDKIINELLKPENNGVIEVKDEEIKILEEFIEKLRESYTGDLIYGKKKPFIMTPILNLQSDVERMKADPSRSIGEKAMKYLKTITFYINSECKRDCDICGSGFKQFMFCKKGRGDKLGVEDIMKVIGEAEGSGLLGINIIGGNILLYDELEELTEKISKLKYLKQFYINYGNIIDYPERIKVFEDREVLVKVLVEPDFRGEDLKRALKLLYNLWIDYGVEFAIRDERDYDVVESIINDLKIEDKSELKPYYTGENIDFFRENVFTEKEDIKEERLDFKEINGRRALNFNDFGRLTILEDGSVYANLNNKRLGNIKDDSLYEIIYREMDSGASWLKTRDKVEPCKSCLYKYLCPSISNYEYAIGKFNLCRIRK